MRHHYAPRLTRMGKITIIGLLAVILLIGILLVACIGTYAYNLIFIFCIMPLLVVTMCRLVFSIIDED